jgi:flavin-dependent dehydrogenase
MKRSPPEGGSRFDVLIVGAGPAGLSTALHLLRLDPAWADRIVVLEEAEHPRQKLCGGGLTRLGEEALAALGLELAVPSRAARELRSLADHFDVSLLGRPVFRLLERPLFDGWLHDLAAGQGIEIRQNEGVRSLRRVAAGVEVETSRGRYLASVVVAADGAESRVRRSLQPREVGRYRSLLMETSVAETPRSAAGVAWFDFTEMDRGVQGYRWEFPALREGAPARSFGIFHSQIGWGRPRIAARRALLQGSYCGGARREIHGLPLRWLAPRRRAVSAHRLIYVGDAAGVDPMLGEGISFAIAYGEVAAEAIRDAFAGGDFGFVDYYPRIRRHRITSHLNWRRRVALLFYNLRSPVTIRLLWALIPWITRLLLLFVPRYIPATRPRLVVNARRRIRRNPLCRGVQSP